MKMPPSVIRGTLILPDRLLDSGGLRIEHGRIVEVGPAAAMPHGSSEIDAGDGYVVPGFVDLHVHGGAGADFMDGTAEAFATALAAHARHGTTSMAVTTTVARHDQIM